VDEGRHPGVRDARTQESQNDFDRAEAEAELSSNAPESIDTWCRARGSSKEEGVNLVRWTG
jgi:hypothetical protein